MPSTMSLSATYCSSSLGGSSRFHVQELAAQEADALGAGLLRLQQLVRQLDIALQRHTRAIGRDRRDLAEPGELALAPLKRPAAALETCDRRLAGIDHEPAAHAVYRHDVAGAHGACEARDAEYCRQPERARHDRGMPLGPALHCGEAADTRRVHQCGIGRRDFLGDDDGAGEHAGECLIGRRESGCARGARSPRAHRRSCRRGRNPPLRRRPARSPRAAPVPLSRH